jgi:hypothetical protein
MAKKKSEPATEPKAQAKQAAAKKPPSKKEPAAAASAASTKPAANAPAKAQAKSPAAKSKPNLLAGGGGSSFIDTGLAASAAAHLLLARRKGRDQLDDPISIDQIKSDLTKDHAAVAGDVLDQHAESTGTRRPDLPFTPGGGGRSGGAAPHSQTVGHAAERTAVPRRNAG